MEIFIFIHFSNITIHSIHFHFFFQSKKDFCITANPINLSFHLNEEKKKKNQTTGIDINKSTDKI
jgi:hypothetical protein